jgi:hypothetical protein
MTRNGKIARLPLSIRQQLNQRLQDGQKGRPLVAWLNGLPEVQAVLAAEFNGKPIAECNLSRWKNGGYESWEEEQSLREAATAMIEESPALKEADKDGLSDRMALLLTARMALRIKHLDFAHDEAGKSEKWRDVLEQFAMLRRYKLQGERLRLHWEKLGFRREVSQWKARKASAVPGGATTSLKPPEVNCGELH